MIPFKNLLVRVVTGTTSATPGTRTNHAHGLSRAPLITRVLIQAQGPANNTDNSPNVSITAVDATNITVKSNQASTAFTAFIFRDIDDAGRNQE